VVVSLVFMARRSWHGAAWGPQSAPLVVAIVRPPAMPFMTVALIVELWFFDRPARVFASEIVSASDQK
jgi:hypothetical protein